MEVFIDDFSTYHDTLAYNCIKVLEEILHDLLDSWVILLAL